MVVTREQLQSEYPSLWFCIISLKTILSNLPGANETRVFEIKPHWNKAYPDSKVYGANTGPTWVQLAPDGPMLAPWTLLSGYLSCIINIIDSDEMTLQWVGASAAMVFICGIYLKLGQPGH